MNVYKAVMLRAPDGYHMPKDFYAYSGREDYVLTSLIAGFHARVIFPIAQRVGAPDWLQAQGYHLTAFTTESAARDFVKSCDLWHSAVVFEARAFDVLDILPRRAITMSLSPISEMRFPHTFGKMQIPWPVGTIMAKELQLLRCVWSMFPYPPLGIVCTEWPIGGQYEDQSG